MSGMRLDVCDVCRSYESQVVLSEVNVSFPPGRLAALAVGPADGMTPMAGHGL